MLCEIYQWNKGHDCFGRTVMDTGYLKLDLRNRLGGHLDFDFSISLSSLNTPTSVSLVHTAEKWPPLLGRSALARGQGPTEQTWLPATEAMTVGEVSSQTWDTRDTAQ